MIQDATAETRYISRDTAARILAVAYLKREEKKLTLPDGCRADFENIRCAFDISNGETLDAELTRLTHTYTNECVEYMASHGGGFPAWATDLFQRRYGVKI